MAVGDFITKHFSPSSETKLPTAPASPTGDGNNDEPIASLSEQLAAASIQRRKAHPNALTPPRSSTASVSSSTQTEGEDEPTAKKRGRRKRSSRQSSVGRHLSASDGVPLPHRRNASGLNPLSAITTTPSVSAPELSNPTSHRSSVSPGSSAFAPAISQEVTAQSSLVSCLENTKLTDDVAEPRTKNTPPQTPRALSNDGIKSARTSTTAVNTPRSNQSPARDPKNGSLPVGPPRGRLSVKISEARGLRPCYDPYVVCVFEWNESIANNEPKGGVEMERDPSRGREESLGGVPVSRSGSDMGRSIAIPMKSRQSSTTSQSEQKKFRKGNCQVTDPRWDHEAMLYVFCQVLGTVAEAKCTLAMSSRKSPVLTSTSMTEGMRHSLVMSGSRPMSENTTRGWKAGIA